MVLLNTEDTDFQFISFGRWEVARTLEKTPRLDRVVNVENCYYYLALLESFYKIEQYLGPELFKRFIIVGERRYMEFIRNLTCKDSRDIRYPPNAAVPLDVAYAWHAHLMAPYQYKEDITAEYDRSYRCPAKIQLNWESHLFPLEAMFHTRRYEIYTRSKNLNSPGDIKYCSYLFPYRLSKEELENTSLVNTSTKHWYARAGNICETEEGEKFERRALYIHCASCGTKIFFENWIDYAVFRTDRTVVLKCPSFKCKHPDNTIDSLIIENLLSDLQFNIKGTTYDNNGKKKSAATISNQKRCNKAIQDRIDSSEKVFKGSKDWNTVLDIIHECATDKQYDLEYKDKDNDRNTTKSSSSTEQDKLDGQYIKELPNIIETTYKNNPMRTSLDLVQAMWNQREFIHTTVTKMKSKSKTLLKSDFPRAIKDYHDFLLLLKLQKPEDQDAILPTSWEVEMIWRLHMLHPPKYYRMMESQLGRVPNHNTIIHTSEIEQSHMRTRNAWEQVPPRLTRRVDVDQIKALAHRKGSKKNSRNSRYYNQLRSKFINGNMKNKISIALPEEQKDGFLKKKLLSKHHHGGDRKKQQPFLPIMTGETNSLNLDSIATVVEQVRKDILVNIAHTGHGYIGSIFDGERVYQEEMTTVSKRILAARTYAPVAPEKDYRSSPKKRCYGRIPPESRIVVYHRGNREEFIGKHVGVTRYSIPELPLKERLKKKEKEYEWWVPQNELYGMMRRSFSKKHQQWGWTTDGLDWYSEQDCNFKTVPDGKFIGALFQPPKTYRAARVIVVIMRLEHHIQLVQEEVAVS